MYVLELGGTRNRGFHTKLSSVNEGHIFLCIAVKDKGDTGRNIRPTNYLLHIDTRPFKLVNSKESLSLKGLTKRRELNRARTSRVAVTVLEPLLHRWDVEGRVIDWCRCYCPSLWGLHVPSRVGIRTRRKWIWVVHPHGIVEHGWHYPWHCMVRGRVSVVRQLIIGNGCRFMVLAAASATARSICKCIDSRGFLVNGRVFGVLYTVLAPPIEMIQKLTTNVAQNRRSCSVRE